MWGGNVTNGTLTNGATVDLSDGTLSYVVTNGTVNFKGTITSSADNIRGMENIVESTKKLTLTGGIIAFGSPISGGGDLVIQKDKTVTASDSIKTHTLLIDTGATLNIDVDLLGGDVLSSTILTNNGTLALGADGVDQDSTSKAHTDTLQIAVSGGKVKFNGNIFSNANYVQGDTNEVAETKTLTLTGGALGKALSGAGITRISTDNKVVANNSIATVGGIQVAKGTLESDAGYIDADVTNSAIVDLTGGTLEHTIIGGTINVKGNVTSLADYIGGTVKNEVIETRSLTLTGGILGSSLVGGGTTVVSSGANVESNGSIGTTNITNKGTLTISADNIDGTTDNGSGIINMEQGTLEKIVTGGVINTAGNVSALVTNLNGNEITNNAAYTLTLTGNGTFNGTVSGSGTMEISTGANVQVESGKSITQGNLKINNLGALGVEVVNLTIAGPIQNSGMLTLTGTGVLQEEVTNYSSGAIGTFVIGDGVNAANVTAQKAVNNNILVNKDSQVTIGADHVQGNVELKENSQIVVNSNGTFDRVVSYTGALNSSGTVTVNKDTVLGTNVTVTPSYYLDTATRTPMLKLDSTPMTLSDMSAADRARVGTEIMPMSGVNVGINAVLQVNMNASGSGAFNDVTISKGGHLDLINNSPDMVIIGGKFTSGVKDTSTGKYTKENSGRLSLDILSDSVLDSFVVFGDAEGAMTIDTMNIGTELLTDLKPTGTEKGGVIAPVPIYGTNNLDVYGTTTVYCGYKYSVEEVTVNSGGSIVGFETGNRYTYSDFINKETMQATIGSLTVGGKAFLIIKQMGFNLREILQNKIDPIGSSGNYYRAANISTYSFTSDLINLGRVTAGVDPSAGDLGITNMSVSMDGGDLGVLTRVNAGEYGNDGYGDGTKNGMTGGSPNRLFTINGNNHAFYGGQNAGVTVQEGDTLVLTNISEMDDFKNGVISDNSGTFQINAGTTVLNASVTGSGTTVIQGTGTDVTLGNLAHKIKWTLAVKKVKVSATDAENKDPSWTEYDTGTAEYGTVWLETSKAIDTFSTTPVVLRQGDLQILSGKLTASADQLQIGTYNGSTVTTYKDIANAGTLVLTSSKSAGGTLTSSKLNNKLVNYTDKNGIVHTGTVQIGTGAENADVLLNGHVSNLINVSKAATLTIDADNVGNDITQTDTTSVLKLTADNTDNDSDGNIDTLAKIVTGGKLRAEGNIYTEAGNIAASSSYVKSGITLTLMGGTLKKTVMNEEGYKGRVAIKDNSTVTATALVAPGTIEVGNGATLIADADFIGAAITDNGNVQLTSDDAGLAGATVKDTLRYKVTGGILQISGNVSSNAGYIQGNTNTVDANKMLTLTGDTLTKAITGGGITNVDGIVVSEAKIDTAQGILVQPTGSLTIAADNLAASTTNRGSLTVNGSGANLGAKIEGNGTTFIAGDVNNVGDGAYTVVQDNMTISGSYTVRADTLSVVNTIANKGTLKLAGGASPTQIIEFNSSTDNGDGIGQVVVDGFVYAKKSLVNTINVLTDKYLQIGATDVGGIVTNGGTVALLEGTLGNKINGGKLLIKQNVESSADYIRGTVNEVEKDKILTLNAGTIAETSPVKGQGGVVIKIGSEVTAEGRIMTKSLLIDNNATLNIDVDLLGGDILGGTELTNRGTLALSGDNKDQDSSVHSSSTDTLQMAVVGGEVLFNGDIKSAADYVKGNSNTVSTGKSLSLTGGTLTGALGGEGETKITGDVKLLNVLATKKIIVDTGKKMTALANYIGSDVTNKGTVSLTGNVLSRAISGGTISVDGIVSSNADYIKGDTDTVNSGKSLDLTGGMLTKSLGGDGKTIITNTVDVNALVNTQAGILVNNNATLYIGAANVGVDITDNGTVNLEEGTLGHSITGGVLNVIGNVTSDADYVKGSTNDVANGKTLTLTGGTISRGLSGKGKTVINATVKAETEIKTAGGIVINSSTGKLITDVDYIGNTVTNNGELYLTGDTKDNDGDGSTDTLKYVVGGSSTGSTVIVGGTVYAKADIENKIKVTEGATLQISAAYVKGNLELLNRANVVVDGAGELNKEIKYTGDSSDEGAVITVNAPISTGEKAAFSPSHYCNFAGEVVPSPTDPSQIGVTVLPMSNVSVVLNASFAQGKDNEANSGGLKNFTIHSQGHLNLANGMKNLMVIGGNFSADSGSRLSLDVMKDGNWDEFMILGKAKGTLQLDTVSVQEELIKGGEKTNPSGTEKVAVLQNLHIGTNDGFKIQGTTSVLGAYRYTFEHVIVNGGNITYAGTGDQILNSDFVNPVWFENSKTGISGDAILVTKEVGFTLQQIIQSYYDPVVKYNAGNISTYTFTNDAINMKTSDTDTRDLSLGTLKRVGTGTAREFLLDGTGGSKLYGGRQTGITVNGGDTFRFTRIGLLDDFKDGLLGTNNGTMEFVTGDLQLNASVNGSGKVQISGANVTLGEKSTEYNWSSSNSPSIGSVRVEYNNGYVYMSPTAVKTKDVVITQKDLTIAAGSLKANAGQLKITNAITNGGTLILTGGVLGNILNNQAKSDGTGTITGTLRVDGSVKALSSIYNSINIISGGTLTVDADNVLGAVVNNGTLLLAGDGTSDHPDVLGQDVLGDDGTLDVRGCRMKADKQIVQKELTVEENSSLTVGANNLNISSGAITNNGNLVLTGIVQTLQETVEGSGVTYIGDGSNSADITANAKISTGIDVLDKGKLIVKATNIGGSTNRVEANGVLHLNGGTLNNEVTGLGLTEIVADTVKLEAGLGTEIIVNVDTGLLTKGDYIGHNIVNKGTVTLIGGTLGYSISSDPNFEGGVTIIDGDVVATEAISNKGGISVNVGKSLEIKAADLQAATLNAGTLILGDGDLGVTISDVVAPSGMTSIKGRVTNSTNKMTVTQKNMEIQSSGALTTSVDRLVITGGTISNSGTLTLTGKGVLEEALTGMGTAVFGDGSNNDDITVTGATVANSVYVKNNATLTVNAGILDNNSNSVEAGGVLKLTGGTLDNSVSGKGQTIIASGQEVTAKAYVGTELIVNGGSLNIAAGYVGGEVNNDAGVVNLGEGTLEHKVNGGTLNILENVASSADFIAGESNILGVSKQLTLTGGTLMRPVTESGVNKSGVVAISGLVHVRDDISTGKIAASSGSIVYTGASYIKSAGELANAAKVVIDKAGTFNQTLRLTGSTGSIEINEDTVLGSQARFQPTGSTNVGGQLIPLSGIDVNLNARLSKDVNSGSGSGGFNNMTIASDGYLDLINGAADLLVVGGKFTAETGAKVALDLISDDEMDGFAVLGQATGSLTLARLNVTSELMKGAVLEEYKNKTVVALPLYGSGNNLTISSATAVYAQYSYSMEQVTIYADGTVKYSGGELETTKGLNVNFYKDNALETLQTQAAGKAAMGDQSGVSAVIITKGIGFSLPEVIQGAIRSVDAFDAAKVNNYSFTSDMVNLTKEESDGMMDGGDLGVLQRQATGMQQDGEGNYTATGRSEDPREFNLSGNGKAMYGGNHGGVTIQAGDTFTVAEISLLDDFKDGKLAINDGIFEFIKGNTQLNASIDGNGKFLVSGANVTLGSNATTGYGWVMAESSTITPIYDEATGKYFSAVSTMTPVTGNAVVIKQAEIEVGGTASLTANANQLVAENIVNSGTLTLTGGVLTSAVVNKTTGSGAAVGMVNITGEVAAKEAINSKVAVDAAGELSIAANNLLGGTSLNGKLVLSEGQLQSDITGSGALAIASGTVNAVTSKISVGSLQITDANAVLRVDAGKLSVSGQIDNNGIMTLTGGTLNNSLSGQGTLNIAANVAVGAGVEKVNNAISIESAGKLAVSPAQLGGDVTNEGELLLGGGTLDKHVSGTGTLKLTDSVLDVVADLSCGELVLSNAELTTSYGTGFSLTGLKMTNSVLYTDAVNLLNFTVDGEGNMTDDLSAKVDLSGLTGVDGTRAASDSIILQLAEDGTIVGYTTDQLMAARQALLGDPSNNILEFKNGRVSVGEGQSVVIKGEVDRTDSSNPVIVIDQYKPDLIDEHNGKSLLQSSQFATKYIQVAEKDSVDDTKVEVADNKVVLQDVKTINITNTVAVAKGIQVKGDKYRQIDLKLGSGVNITLTGHDDINMYGTVNEKADGVTDRPETSVDGMNLVITDGAQFTLGLTEKDGGKTEKQQMRLSSIVMGANTSDTKINTVNVINGGMIVDKIDTVGDGTGKIFVDPAYLCIKEAGETKVSVEVDTDGAVLNYGAMSDLEGRLNKVGYETKNISKTGSGEGFIVKNEQLAVIALNKSTKLSGNGKLVATADRSTEPALEAGSVSLDSDSLLVVNAAIAKEDDGGAITGIKDLVVNAGAKLFLTNLTEEGTYIIFSGEGVKDGVEYYDPDKDEVIMDDDKLMSLEIATGLTNAFGFVASFNNLESIYGVGNVAALNCFTEIKNSKEGLFGIIKATSGGKATAEMKAAGAETLNAIANVGELAAVQHGSVMMVNQVGSAICDNMSVMTRPIIPSNKAKTVKTSFNDGYAHLIEVVDVGEVKDLMPQVYEAPKYEKTVWASYMRNKENVEGMELDRIQGNYDANYNGITVGADLWSTHKSVGGIAVSYTDGDVSGVNGTTTTKNEVEYTGVAVYNRITNDHSAVIADIGYMRSENDIRQNIGITAEKLTANAKVNAATMGLRTERPFRFAGGVLAPHAGVRYIHVNNKSYTDSQKFTHDSKDQNIFVPEIGIAWTGEFNLSKKWKMRPLAEAGFMWNLGDVATEQTISFGGASDVIGYDITDSHSYYAKIGTEFVRANLSFGIFYKYQKGKTVKDSKLNVNMDYQF